MNEVVVVSLVGTTLLSLLVVALGIMNRRQRVAIRERVLAESRRAESEGVFRDIFESTLSGYWDWNLVDGTEHLSPAFKRMFGYEDHEMESSPEAWQRIIVPEDLDRTLEVFDQHVESRGRVPFYVEVRYRHRDGSTVWVICAGRVIEWAEDGTALRMVGCHIDISGRKRAEEDREKSDERFRIAQDMSPDGFTILRPVRDDQDRVVDFAWVYENEAIAKLNGTDPQEVVGKRLLELFPGHRDTQFLKAYRQVAESGTPMTFEDGYSGESMHEEAWFRVVVVPMADDIAVLAQDITQRKREARELDAHRHHLEELVDSRTRDLAEARERAETATRAKSAFLANMSHEIRTPINAVAGLTHLMQRDDPTPAQAERLMKIESATGHLLSIVSDVLDLAKIEADRLVIEERDFHLSAVLDQVRSMVAEAARAKGLRLEVDPDGVPVWLRGDPVRLRQALLNLAGNAVKFTHEGHVALRAMLLGEDDDALSVRFEVEDSGIGIPPERLPALFQAFEQVDPSVTRRFGGTGLGLAVTRRLAELMGGEVGAESEQGRGTRIWFTVRLQRGHGVLPVAPERVHDDAGDHRLLAGARVLLAEDNPINREVALELLHGFGVDAVAAEDGQAAVDLARAGRFDLILMDMHMPVLDGLSATRQIRGLPGYARVPILALTANAFEDDRRACLAAGMDGFVSKPVSPPVLRRAMAEGLRSAQQRRAGDLAVPGVEPRPPEGPTHATAPAVDGSPDQAADAVESTAGAAQHGLPAPLRWPGLEPSVAIATVGGPADLVRILHCLLAFHMNDARELEAELAAGNAEAATFRAHRLKGAAGTLGAVALQRAAGALESAFREDPGDSALLAVRVAAVASELTDLGDRLAQVLDAGVAP